LAEYYFRAYLPTIEHRSANWKNQVGWAMDLHILPPLGERRLSELNRAEIQRVFNRLLNGMMSSSANKVKIVFSGVLNLAIADEKLSSNPCRAVKLPAPEEPDKTALTWPDLAKLILASGPELETIVYLCACAGGLRIGEACGASKMMLTSDDVLHVRQQVLQLDGGSRIVKKLKTSQTRRDLPLPAGLAEAIRTSSQGRLYLSGTARGKHMLPNNATTKLHAACLAAGISPITPHELRHTFISLMENEIEAPAPIVAALAGRKHRAVSKMTGGYSHTQKEQLKRWLSVYWVRLQKEIVTQKNELQSELA
jgi:integrase